MTKWFLNFSFNGRARRSHYWANFGAWLAIMVLVVGVGMGATGGSDAGGAVVGLVLLIAALCSILDNMAMVFRRAHDTGRSGWIWILLLIPIVNLLPFYWLMIQDSDQGPNKYGPPVKTFYVAAQA